MAEILPLRTRANELPDWPADHLGADPLAALLARLIADPSIDPRVREWCRRLAAGDPGRAEKPVETSVRRTGRRSKTTPEES